MLQSRQSKGVIKASTTPKTQDFIYNFYNMTLEKQNKNVTIPVDIVEEKSVKGDFIGEKEVTSEKYGDFKVLEFQKEDGQKVSLIKYTDLIGYDWNSYLYKTVEIILTGKDINKKTGRTQYTFDVLVDNIDNN